MKLNKFSVGLNIFILCIFLCGKADAQSRHKKHSRKKPHETGLILYGEASFYAGKFHGRKTANGETFSQKKFTAACNDLPLGTWIQVANLANDKITVVKTNDRLAPKSKRLIDLSRAAAKKLGFISAGTAKVKIEVLDQSLYK